MRFISILILLTELAFAQNGSLRLGRINTMDYKDKSTSQQSAVLFSFQPNENLMREKKSVALAAIYSFILPGMGELYAGNYSKGKYFTIAEGLLWITYIGFDRYGTWVRDDARNYAVRHAGISLEGKDDRYFVDIGDYQSVQDYNADMLRNRQPHKAFNDPSYAWNWDSKANQDYYYDLRVESDLAFNNLNFVAAAIGVNHLISAINAALTVRSQNENLENLGLLDVHASVMGGINNPHGIMFSFSKNF
ncbi:MAG: hypothetical protein QME52_10380 [Bacteroidota bacterium]|nr:hypothetical protein [Bacteroidota bacterium]